jgi:hypothetical protein
VVEKMTLKKILFMCILVALLVPGVLAADVYTLDPGTSTDWNLWILSGLIGLVLFFASLRAPKNSTDVEIDAIISVISWIPIAFCGYASFNVSRYIAPGIVTLYSMSTIGMVMIAFLILSIGNTFRIILLHRVFVGEPQQQEIDI